MKKFFATLMVMVVVSGAASAGGISGAEEYTIQSSGYAPAPKSSTELKGSVKYTPEQARDEAFSKVPMHISMEEHKKYLVDPGFSRDRNGNARVRKFGRFITFFSDGTYCVSKFWSGISYFYDKNGKLKEINIEVIEPGYPRVSGNYDLNGYLTDVFFDVNIKETYIFTSDRIYEGRWVDNILYDENGKIIRSRSSKVVY